MDEGSPASFGLCKKEDGLHTHVEDCEDNRPVNVVLVDTKKFLAIKLLYYFWLKGVPQDVALENDLWEALEHKLADCPQPSEPIDIKSLHIEHLFIDDIS